MESLLIEKPENPIGFIVEFLQKKYPDQAGIGALATAAAGAVGAAAADAGADSDDADSDSDDEDDYIDELPTVKTNSGKSGKRDSIFAAAPQGSLEDIKKVEKVRCPWPLCKRSAPSSPLSSHRRRPAPLTPPPPPPDGRGDPAHPDHHLRRAVLQAPRRRAEGNRGRGNVCKRLLRGGGDYHAGRGG